MTATLTSPNGVTTMPKTTPTSQLLTTEVVTITPELAGDWLTEAGENRPLSEWKVKQYATAMTNGKWMLNGESIIFDTNGQLMDGQHRLSAVVASGVTIESNVIRGIPRAAFTTIDTGKNRGGRDVLAIAGYPQSAKLAAACTVILHYQRTQILGRLGRSRSSLPTPDDILRTIQEHPRILDSLHYIDSLGIGRMFRGTSPSTLVALHFLISEDDAEKRDEFFDHLASGSNLDRGNPILTLRNRLLINAQKRNISDVTVAAFLVKAWNAHKAGQTLLSLRWNGEGELSEDFPVIN